MVYTIFPSHFHEEVPYAGLNNSTIKYAFDKYTVLLTLKLRSKVVLLYLKYVEFIQNFSATFEEKRTSDIRA